MIINLKHDCYQLFKVFKNSLTKVMFLPDHGQKWHLIYVLCLHEYV